MPTAKDTFLERIKYIRKSLGIQALNDTLPINAEHNNIAKLLRNGMAVVGFVSLEDYLKRRSGEALSLIGTFPIPFDDLPAKLKYSTTVDVIQALIKLVKLQSSEQDQISFIQAQTSKIASTANTAYDLSEFAFGHKSSNLNSEEIKTLLKAYNIQNAWNLMSAISSRIGLTGLPLENSFKNAADRRHKAAHDAHSNIPVGDLVQFINEALAIAITFDSLLTKALKKIEALDANYIAGNVNIQATDVSLSSIKLENGLWKYKKETRAVSLKNNVVKNDLLAYAIPRAQQNGETLLIYDEYNLIANWICN
jgi:hypothetical protein